MLFARLDKPESQGLLEPGVKKALDYAAAHDLAALETGMHPIDGDELFVNIVEYTTKAAEDRFWEAHKDYLDVHVPLNGREQIDLGFISAMDLKPYEPEGDFQPMEGEKIASVIMEPGTFLVCYPEDGHRTAVALDGRPETVRKAIFKVKIH